MSLAYRFLFLALSIHAFCCGEEYVVRYQTLSYGSLFQIETKKGEPVGTVVRSLDEKGKVYFTYYSSQEQLIAQASLQHLDASTTKVVVLDPRGEELGYFQVYISNLYPLEYHIFHQNQLLALGQMNWLRNAFSFVDPTRSDHYIASFFRPMFRLFNDHWHFEVHNNEVVDASFWAIIGAYQAVFELKFESPSWQ